jgi:hypothetical protein
MQRSSDVYLLKAVGSITQVSQHIFVLILRRAHVFVLFWQHVVTSTSTLADADELLGFSCTEDVYILLFGSLHFPEQVNRHLFFIPIQCPN